jgi:hypothetical protein
VPTRAQVKELPDSRLSHEIAARGLGIRLGLAYMIATGRPADDDEAAALNLFEPPTHDPTRNRSVDAWVKAWAKRELRGAR